MSMTVYSTLQGITDLELLLEALRTMGFAANVSVGSPQAGSGKEELAVTWIGRRSIPITRSGKSGELELVGDSDWHFMKDRTFRNRLRQQYSVATVKRKVSAMNYQVSSVTTQEDGSIRILATAWG